MKRIVMMLTVALVIAAMVVAMAIPASAEPGGGATVEKFGPCSTGLEDSPEAQKCQIVTTPSDHQTIQVHHKSDDPGPSGGDGAVVEEPLCPDPQSGDPQSGHAVTTPSGNINAHCQGSAAL
jgi:hypothetical protein